MKKDKLQLLKETLSKELVKIIAEAKIKKANKVKKAKLEGLSVESHGGIEKDDVGRFWVVINPSRGTNEKNIVFETDVFNFNEKINQGLALETIKGIYRKEESARRIGGRLLRERESTINDAKNSVLKLKGLRDEVASKAQALKQSKVETISAVSKINESAKKKTDKFQKSNTKQVFNKVGKQKKGENSLVVNQKLAKKKKAK